MNFSALRMAVYDLSSPALRGRVLSLFVDFILLNKQLYKAACCSWRPILPLTRDLPKHQQSAGQHRTIYLRTAPLRHSGSYVCSACVTPPPVLRICTRVFSCPFALIARMIAAGTASPLIFQRPSVEICCSIRIQAILVGPFPARQNL